MTRTERFKIYENEEGTVIAIDGHPIQFSLILSDEQIGKYLLARGEQKRSAEIAQSSPEYWQGACR